MQSCISKLAASIGMDCAHPLVGGYTGRALIFDCSDGYEVYFDKQNPRVVVDLRIQNVPCRVDNAMLTTPFDGSNVTGSNDTGVNQFTKTFSGRVLTRGANVSRDIVEVLASGRFVVALERRETYTMEDGRGIELIGAIKPARCVDPSTIVRNENENGGATSFGLQTVEPYFDVDWRESLEEIVGMTNHQFFDLMFEDGESAASLAMFAEH